MNKTMKDSIKETMGKVKMCSMGKIADDIASRIPNKPDPMSSWEKYKMIKSGEAKLMLNLTRKQVDTSGYNTIYLVDAYKYPVSQEQVEYDKASDGCKEEKITRELACELAFNRIANEHILGMIDAKMFLDELDAMAQQKW